MKQRGAQLLKLRKALGLSQENVSDLSGLVRSEISNAEQGKVAWRSDKLWQGLGKAFGLSREKLEDYLDGRMVLEQALAAARERAEFQKAQERLDRAIDEAARAALASTDLTRDRYAPAILIFLREYQLSRGNLPLAVKTLTPKAIEVRDALADLGAQLSHKSVSETSHVRKNRSAP
jgi:transcriptional regulator with XRE-family HTH domain